MNIWHDIAPHRISPEKFTAVVEISKGSKNKYELDKETGLLRLDRVLFTSMRYPANYGFIPHTLSLDGDPLDVLIFCQEDIVPMTLVECRPIGILAMTDEEEIDEKIIAVPVYDPSMSDYVDMDQLPAHLKKEIKHFFEVYKALEEKTTLIDQMAGSKTAKTVILRAMQEYKTKNPKNGK
ncbi:MAG: inorganic diphosphatase [Clostridiales bacterium]|nr:inorganic diphosphatase [Clostridiales bacterium]